MATFSIYSARPSRVLFAGLAVGLLAIASVRQAHAEYLWLQKDASGGATAHVGGLDSGRQPLAGVVAPRAFLADGKDLPLTTDAERFSVPVSDAGDLRMVARRVADNTTLTVYQARWGRAETQAVNDLELVPTMAHGNTFKLVWKGKTVAASQVNVETSEGWRRVLKPDSDGTVSFNPSFPGLYVLEVTAKVNGSVTVDGKKYDDVRHTATLSFEVVR